MTRFPTDQDCFDELIKHIVVKCNRCQSKRVEIKVGRRDALCLQCNRKTWITAKTFFNAVKKPRIYLVAIIAMGSGIIFNGAELARAATIAVSSAQHVIKRVSSVLIELMAQACVGTLSSEFAPCVIRRSTESPAKNHTHAEFDEVEKQLHTQRSNEQAVLDTLGDDEKTVYSLFQDQPISVSELELKSGLKPGQLTAALTMLEIELLIQKSEGTSYVRLKQIAKPTVTSSSKQLNRFIRKNLRLIRKCFKGVSRKYLQIYLATCWCLLDRSTWTVQNLLKACANSKPISTQDLIEYVSPPVVLLCQIA
ncbi:MAG: hypothetical protein JST89_23015 [Cyanobacteria bacterium SZAS-4]|nr:hypothetical protein [Cyanobacteria bacterium SZAS-4]